MPVKLYALAWSNQDRLAIEKWMTRNADKVEVVGWSKILTEPLHDAVQDSGMRGLPVQGVVITDHATCSEESLTQALTKLSGQNLKLYSVSHGTEPVTQAKPAQR